MELPPLIRSLSKPSAYPDSPDTIELKQTHISYLFFTPKYVYKIKKSVDFGFLDFTTLEKRRFFCHQEIALNKRLCPEIYIGVVEATKTDDGFVFEGKGEAVEYAVKMKRLPPDKMFDHMLKKDTVTESMVEDIADVIASFHKKSETNLYISEFGRPAAIEKNTEENFTQNKDFVGRTITAKQYDTIKNYTQNFLKARSGLFAKRAENCFIKDCHGDIHSEHICVTNGIYIFDCIEFNERFRYSDTVADIAFLAMDLDFYNRHDLATAFCNKYILASKDRDANELLDFYKCYRAYVRGKVEGFKIDQKEVPEKEKKEAKARARKYFHLAALYASDGFRPALILICGLTGTGKTTLAGALAAETGIKVISSDIVRKELAHIASSERRLEEFEKGIYTKEWTEKTYSEMINRAKSFLRKGVSVILDATFLEPAYRQKAYESAKELGAEFQIIECVAPDETVKERLGNRARQEGVASDGRWEIYVKQKEKHTQPSSFYIDTSLDIDTIKNAALDNILGW